MIRGIDNALGFLLNCIEKYRFLWHAACDTVLGK